jgi:hypothetical protein
LFSNVNGNVIIGTARAEATIFYLNLKLQNDKDIFIIDNSFNTRGTPNNVANGRAIKSSIIVGTGKYLSSSNYLGIPHYLYELNLSSVVDPSYSYNNFDYLSRFQVQNYIHNETANYMNLQPNILTNYSGLTFNCNLLSYKNTNYNSVVFSLDTKNLVPTTYFPKESLNFNICCDISNNYLRYYILENNNTRNVNFNSYNYVYIMSNITNNLNYNGTLLSDVQANLNLNTIQINYLSVNGDGSKIIYCDAGNNNLLYSTNYDFQTGSWNPIQQTLNNVPLVSMKGLILNTEGYRGVCCANGLFYYFIFNNNTYSALTPILDVETRNYVSFDMTPDGYDIYACDENNIYYSSWNGINYSTFTSKITSTGINAVAITNNSQILVYSNSSGIYYSVGSGFSSSRPIQTFTNDIKQLKFSPYQNNMSILYGFTSSQNNNYGMYYWYLNSSNSPYFSTSFLNVSTSIVPANTDYTNISMNSIGSQIYYTTLNGNSINILNIPTISNKNVNSLNSLTSNKLIADGSNNFNISINMGSDGKTSIYVNDVLDISGTLQYPSSINRNDSYIGCNTSNYNLLSGNMKSFQMYKQKIK